MISLYIFLLIFSISAFILIYIKRDLIGKKFKVIDIPNESRKIHSTPVPKTASC